MHKNEVIQMIVRQYGGFVEPGVNWTWACFPGDAAPRMRRAYYQIKRRFPELDDRGLTPIGFRFR